VTKKLTAAEKRRRKAARIRTKEVQAVLDGQRCDWNVAYDNQGQRVTCDRPAWLRPPRSVLGATMGHASFCCPFHASLKTEYQVGCEVRRNIRKYGAGAQHPTLTSGKAYKKKTRAEIIAIRDGEAVA
jgi:hypothetical protein